MNDLVLKINGEVVSSNFDEFKTDALALVKAADKKLVTDNDFAEAEKTAKNCKVAEDAIKSAKTESLKEVADINKLFEGLDEVSAALRKTRLSLSKKVKAEKAARRFEVVDSAHEEFNQAITKVAETLPEIYHVVMDNREVFESAVSGKKKIESMKEAVDKELGFQLTNLNDKVILVSQIVKKISVAEKEYPGLFPDVKTLVSCAYGEVSAIIKSRVAEFKLAEKEKQERVEAEKRRAEEKEEIEAEKGKVAKEPETPVAEQKTEGTPVVSEKRQKDAEEQVGTFVLTISMSGVPSEARSVAKQIDALVNSYEVVDRISLSRV